MNSYPSGCWLYHVKEHSLLRGHANLLCIVPLVLFKKKKNIPCYLYLSLFHSLLSLVEILLVLCESLTIIQNPSFETCIDIVYAADKKKLYRDINCKVSVTEHGFRKRQNLVLVLYFLDKHIVIDFSICYLFRIYVLHKI